jgi:hypothetical protein
MTGKSVALLTIAALLPLTHLSAASPAPPAQPAELLRFLASGVVPWDPIGSNLVVKPEALLDAIFLPQGNDTPTEESQRLALFWISRLNDENFHARQEASARLLDLGTAAIPAVKQAILSPDPEVRHRARTAFDLLQSKPMLADLNYSQVRQSVTSISSAIAETETLESIITSILRRLGPPTIHNRETWILQPFFRELVKRNTPRSPQLISKALAHPHQPLPLATANAIREATIENGINPIYLLAITKQKPQVTSILLDHAPSLPTDSPHAIPYLNALNALLKRTDLPPLDLLKTHRLHLIAFQSRKSLATLVANGSSQDETILELIANTLTDPRLTGLPLGNHPTIATWSNHPHENLRIAAGTFLITRPEPANQLASLPFIPHFDRKTVEKLEPLLECIPDPSALRKALRQLITRQEKGWEIAEDLIIALPPNLDEIPLTPGFGFE